MKKINYDHAEFKIENFIKLYERSFVENWDLKVLSDYSTGTTQTYGEFAIDLLRMHVFFESIGLKKGDRVALCAKDTPQWVKIYMGVITYGAVIVPILADFNPVDVAHIVNHSESVLFFVSRSIWEHIDPDTLHMVKGVISSERYEVFYERKPNSIAKGSKQIAAKFRKKYPGGVTPPKFISQTAATISWWRSTTLRAPRAFRKV